MTAWRCMEISSEYSGPSVSAGSTSVYSTNCGSKKKNSRKFQKTKLNLLCTRNYLHSIYSIFTTIYVAFILY